MMNLMLMIETLRLWINQALILQPDNWPTGSTHNNDEAEYITKRGQRAGA